MSVLLRLLSVGKQLRKIEARINSLQLHDDVPNNTKHENLRFEFVKISNKLKVQHTCCELAIISSLNPN